MKRDTRTKLLQIRLTEQEHKNLAERAKQAKRTISEYVRHRVISTDKN